MSGQAEILSDFPTEIRGICQRTRAILPVAAQGSLIQGVVQIPSQIDIGRTIGIVHGIIGVHLGVLRKFAIRGILRGNLRIGRTVGHLQLVIGKIIQLKAQIVTVAIIPLHHTLRVAVTRCQLIAQLGGTTIHAQGMVMRERVTCGLGKPIGILPAADSLVTLVVQLVILVLQRQLGFRVDSSLGIVQSRQPFVFQFLGSPQHIIIT